jgi:hypothetical protein
VTQYGHLSIDRYTLTQDTIGLPVFSLGIHILLDKLERDLLEGLLATCPATKPSVHFAKTWTQGTDLEI